MSPPWSHKPHSNQLRQSAWYWKLTIESFQMTMQGIPGSCSICVRGGGTTVLFTSCTSNINHMQLRDRRSPSFHIAWSPSILLTPWLHRPRLVWIWQELDRQTRISYNGISGTGTFLNALPSQHAHWSGIPPVTMADLMETTGGPMC